MSPAVIERRARNLLDRPGAWLDRLGESWSVRLGADRRRRPALRLDADTVQALRRHPGLAPRTDGGWVLSTRAGEGAGGSRLIVETSGSGSEIRRVNRGESPIAWLARRKGPDGEPWLSRAQVMAAERLREDFERAGTLGRLTMDWERGPRDRMTAGPSGPRTGETARRRLNEALEATGPGLREIVEQVCLGASALQAAERNLGLPSRTGRTVLSLALDRLARHYRLM